MTQIYEEICNARRDMADLLQQTKRIHGEMVEIVEQNKPHEYLTKPNFQYVRICQIMGPRKYKPHVNLI